MRFLQGKSAGLVDGGWGHGQTGLSGGRGQEVVVDSGGVRREAAGAEGAADDDRGARLLLLLVGGVLVALDLGPSPRARHHENHEMMKGRKEGEGGEVTWGGAWRWRTGRRPGSGG